MVEIILPISKVGEVFRLKAFLSDVLCIADNWREVKAMEYSINVQHV